MFCKTTYSSAIGNLTLASDGNNLVGLWIEGQKYFGGNILGQAVKKDDLPVFSLAVEWLERYFKGQNPSVSEFPLAFIGSEFCKKVWQILCEIPYGKTITYGDIARQIDCKSAQAVGGAVGHNPISIIIPCHRVLGANGSLTGFAAGIDVKVRLLELEEVELDFVGIKK